MKQALLLELANEVESEMKRLGLWSYTSTAVPTPHQAFGADVLSFEEWLQRVFLPNLKHSAMSNTYPSSSAVSVAAIRNLDGVEGVEQLVALLSRIDILIERG